MEAMVEKVEKNKREEITHQQNSQEERNLESGSSRPDGPNKYGRLEYHIMMATQFKLLMCPRLDYLAI